MALLAIDGANIRRNQPVAGQESIPVQHVAPQLELSSPKLPSNLNRFQGVQQEATHSEAVAPLRLQRAPEATARALNAIHNGVPRDMAFQFKLGQSLSVTDVVCKIGGLEAAYNKQRAA